MPLNALLGQSRAASLLGGALANGRPHHAYLFAGPPGVGKTLAAKLVAQALNCESPAGVAAAERGVFVDDPCGQCPQCRQISDDPKHHAHPLVMWIDTEFTMQTQGLYAPEGDRPPAKAIGVRIVRDLVIPRVALKVIGGRRKVVIFRDVEFNEAAQNAFLKTLEEPPADTTFIILSSTPDLLMQTVRSRCMHVVFAPLPLDVVAARVAKERKIDATQAALCAAVSGGNLGLALKVDAKALQARRDLILRWSQLAGDDWYGWLTLAEDYGEKSDALDAIAILQTWMHDLALAAASEQPPATNIDLVSEAAAAANKLGLPEILRHIELLERAQEQIDGNAQSRLAMERLVLEVNGITPLTMGGT